MSIKDLLNKILSSVKDKKNILLNSARYKAVDVIEWEVSEMENIFTLLIFGSFIGIPTTPSSITLNLLPLMETEINLMMEKVASAAGPISDLFSHLDAS